jgi:putative membrane protein
MPSVVEPLVQRGPVMRTLIILSAATASLFLAACGSREHQEAVNTNTDPTTSVGTVMNETSATTTGSTGGTVSAMSPADKEFVMKAAVAEMAEVRMGQMAVDKASNADVKAFGQRMVTDHGKANEELRQFATIKGLALPTQLDEMHQKASDHLNGLSGAEFDKAYMTHMVEDHRTAVADFEKGAGGAGDTDLKAWAGKTLPVLQDHLREAEATASKVK